MFCPKTLFLVDPIISLMLEQMTSDFAWALVNIWIPLRTSSGDETIHVGGFIFIEWAKKKPIAANTILYDFVLECKKQSYTMLYLYCSILFVWNLMVSNRRMDCCGPNGYLSAS